MAEGHRVSRHISTMRGRVGAGEPAFESHGTGEKPVAGTGALQALRADAGAIMMNAAGAGPGYLMLQGESGVTRCLLPA